MHFLAAIRALHIVAAATALATLWLPLVAKKGGRLHRRIGWVYLASMGGAAATGFSISAWRYAFEPPHRERALFLMYVSLLAATSMTLGVRALRAKSRTAPRHHPLDLGLPALLTAASVALLVHGLGGGHRLAAGFAPVGLLVGAGQLAYWLRPPREKLHWLLQHMGGMIGSGIASLTAFVVTSAPRLGLGSGSLWLWLAPTALGVPGLIAWQRLYRRRSPPLVAVAP